TSSSNFPSTLACLRRRGTRVGTFRGRWNEPTFIFPRTSSRVQPKRASGSASYFETVPCISHTITEVSDVNGFPAIAGISSLRLGGRSEGLRAAHKADLLPVPEHRADREERGESRAVLPDEGHFLLEAARLHGGLQEPRDEGGDVLREVERGDAHLPDHLGGGPAEEIRGVRRVRGDGPWHVARDHGSLGGERLLRGHGSLFLEGTMRRVYKPG